MSDKQIILLMGKSGTGKTTVANVMSAKYGLKTVESYTTRPPRYEGEKGHIFVTDVEYEAMKYDLCAYTEFDGYKYWATNTQIDEADIYIIDPAGVRYFNYAYRGKKNVITIELAACSHTRFERMRARGDSILKCLRRLWHDKKAFKDAYPEILINANINKPEKIADDVYKAAMKFQRFDDGIKEVLTQLKAERDGDVGV